jgi:ribosomal protein L7/L12
MPSCPFCEHENSTNADHCGKCGAALTTIAESRDDDANADAAAAENSAERPMHELLGELLARGRKLEAIKLYRERTGAGLVDAKEAVEAIERSEDRVREIEARAFAKVRELDEIEQVLRTKGKIAAIKLYRERTGKGLKDAKEAVEAFAQERKIPIKNVGCGATVLMFVAVIVAIGLAMAY